jgi:hypothetical protein
MAKFNFDAFDAAVNKIQTAKQAQADVQGAEQAAITAQPDPNIAPVQQAAPAAQQAAPSSTQGFNINAFLGRESEVPTLEPVSQEQPATLDFPSAGAEPAGTEPPVDRSRELLADEKAMQLLSHLGDEIPSEQEDIQAPRLVGVGQPLPSGAKAAARDAASKIKKLGFSDEDIASALALRRAALPPSKKFQQAAGTVAGIGIPLAINLIPGLAAAPEEIITGPLIAKTLTKLGLRAGGVGAAGAAGAIADLAADPDRELTVETAIEAAKAGMIEEGSIEGVFGASEIGMARAFGRGGRMAADQVDELNTLLARSAKRQGISQKVRLLPGQASELPAAQAVEAIAESSLFGANPVAKTKALIRKSAVGLVNELPETFANGASKLSSRSVTNAVADVLKGNQSFHTKAAQSLYDRSFELIDEAGAKLVDITKTVPTPVGRILSETGEPIVKAGTKEVTEQIPRAGLLADLSEVRELGERLTVEFGEAQGFGFEGRVKSLIGKAASVDDTTTVRGIQKMRSEILSLQRDLTSSVNPNSSLLKVVNELTPVLDKTMKSAAEAASGDARRLLLRANKLWKSNAQKFDNEVITSILGKAADMNPEAVFDILNSADEQQVGQLIEGLTRRRGDKTFVNKTALNKIKGGYLAGMINKVSPEDAFRASGKGDAVGDLLLKQFNDMPDAVKSQLFSKSEVKDITNKFRLLSLSQKKGEAGLIGLKAAQGLGAVSLAAAPFSGDKGPELGVAGLGLVIGPSILASLILRRPAFTRLLAEGGKVKATTREGIKITGRLAKMILDERKRITKQRENIDKIAQRKEKVTQNVEELTATPKVPVTAGIHQ